MLSSQSAIPLCLVPSRIAPLKPTQWHVGPTRRHTVRTSLTRSSTKRAALLQQTLTERVPLAVELRKETIEVSVVVTVKNVIKKWPLERLREHLVNVIGLGITVQLISEEIDPETNVGKKSPIKAVRGWLSQPSDDLHRLEYAAKLTVPADFGRPGAIIVTNLHDNEFFLMNIVVHGFSEENICFPGETWIHSKKDNPISRILFSNKAYLPSQTPNGIKDLREDDMKTLRGNGQGERKMFDRIYDYAPYNDLGNPDENDLARPVLGGLEMPYPRRCRTGRPPYESDPSCELRVEKPHPVYVPRDETFDDIKDITFKLKVLLNTTIPSLLQVFSGNDAQFEGFPDIDRLYNDGFLLVSDVILRLIPPSLIKKLTGALVKQIKYDVPSIISKDRFSWLRDNEFARQTLAGVNPVDIHTLKEFPIRSKLDPTVYGTQESALTKEILEQELHGMSLEEAMKEDRLFIIDYHDILLPYITKINSLKDKKMYASRTILMSTPNGVLRPIAIELSLPPNASNQSRKRVYTNGNDATSNWIWKFAKAHACANDAGVHQLVNHWLRTHACMEPYIIAAHRQLSYMHPIFKLLHPHMRYTMEINALARQSLISGGGIIESTFTPGKYSMELSSVAYKSWRFDMESLPADLIRRGMAVEDHSKPHGLRLVVEDYPYAVDGLLVWSALEDWVRGYVNHFYPNSDSVSSDKEIQAWWDEIKNVGHADKKNETWWPTLENKDNLTLILTTMIWTASGQHAAINFGQYPFGGYMPNRPTVMKKLVPEEGELEYQNLLSDPEYTFLSLMPSQVQATQVMTVQNALSTHSPDEEYLVERSHSNWIDDAHVREMFENFSARIEEIEEEINERNKDSNLKNRNGAGVPPYELLRPSSPPGVTGRGIPNSISI